MSVGQELFSMSVVYPEHHRCSFQQSAWCPLIASWRMKIKVNVNLYSALS